ncbi:primosomal protein N' [Bacterioplanes sanyensis]|uniref:Replication restart protein PriA n=1 Tax=Bacterioplanes sanyensis TaxID=1249553 RepID=A0A222FIE5_9GAMM|nr:primosomal protein N' [Bacterioplanes sanyensis]ASP38366.1 primosomal protein N' [Bacterioplanes sanyensis]
MPFFVVDVALPVPLQRSFDYLPCAEDARSDYQPGQRVRVNFANQLLTGVVLGTREQSDVAANKLKSLLQRLDDQPLFDAETLQLSLWLAQYYHHTQGEVLDLMMPAMLRKGSRLDEVDERHWRRLAAANEPTLRGSKQQALWQLFEQQSLWPHQQLTSRGFTQAQLQRLQTLQLIEPLQLLPLPSAADEQQPALALNAQQQQALDQLRCSQFSVSLLEGVTGSGKTEVYLQWIAQLLQHQRQILVLVPEIGLTPQTLKRFRQRFSEPVVALHSGLNDRERLQGWRAAAEGKARIVIGTRSAVFTQMPELGAIIIDEEHDASFKQQDGLRYSARDFAVVRAHQRDIPILLGSATPSLESLHNALIGKYQHIKLTQRAGNAKPPGMMLHSLLHQPLTAGFAQPVLQRMHDTLQAGQQVLVFLNRRGYAPLLACNHCGWMAECRRCDARLTLHQWPHHLHCHHCGHQQAVPAVCPSCHQPGLESIGQGTEKVQQQLLELFPNWPIRRVDRDTVRGKQAFDQLYDDIHDGGPCILVGTQMLAKGHHFPDVTLVVVLDADAGLFSSDFRGMEHSAQLILQVAGRAGRAEMPGEVWIQTLYADHPQLNLLLDNGYHALALSLLQERQQRQLPPYTHLALLRAESEDRHQAEQLLQHTRQHVQHWQRQHPQVRVSLVGPFPAIMERRAGRFRQQLQVHANERQALHQVLHQIIHYLQQQRLPRQLRWHLDVDPIDTL